MKRRVVLILLFVIVGIIGIELFLGNEETPDYIMMDYSIAYQENSDNEKELLTKTKYYTYYFEHFDDTAKVIYENGKKFDLKEAYEKGYLFLGDITKNVNVSKVCNFSLKFTEKKEQALARKLSKNGIEYYYYKINDIKLLLEDQSYNLLELVDEDELTIKDIIYYLEEHQISKEENVDYTIYKDQKYTIMINKDQNKIYFGSPALNSKVIKKGSTK